MCKIWLIGKQAQLRESAFSAYVCYSPFSYSIHVIQQLKCTHQRERTRICCVGKLTRTRSTERVSRVLVYELLRIWICARPSIDGASHGYFRISSSGYYQPSSSDLCFCTIRLTNCKCFQGDLQHQWLMMRGCGCWGPLGMNKDQSSTS